MPLGVGGMTDPEPPEVKPGKPGEGGSRFCGLNAVFQRSKTTEGSHDALKSIWGGAMVEVDMSAGARFWPIMYSFAVRVDFGGVRGAASKPVHVLRRPDGVLSS